jgi:hypothetical protein
MVELVSRRPGTAPIGKKEDIMAETSREALLREVIDHHEGVEMSGTGPSDCGLAAVLEMAEPGAVGEPSTGGSPRPTDTTPSQTPPDAELVRLIFGKNVSMASSIIAKLRVADLLVDGPRTVADLAATTETHAPSLYRILRAQAAVGVFAEQVEDRLALTPMGEYLRTGAKSSLRGIADYSGSDWSWRAWGHPLETVQTGRTAFDSVFGEPVFDYLGKHPDESAGFNEGMTGISSNIAPAVAEAYDFAAFKTVVDVGGGHGVLLNTILQAYAGVNSGGEYRGPGKPPAGVSPGASKGVSIMPVTTGMLFF